MNLTYGSRGDEVKKLQQALNSTGKYTLDVDGSYGPKTQAAVKDYQTKNGLKVDGIAGNETLGKLYQQPAATQPQQTTQQTQQPAQSQPNYSQYAYDPSADAAYQQALTALQQAQATLPSYKGSYDQQLQDIYNQIVNRDKFSYDLNSDMLYQQYADQYAQQGKMAMMDTMGQAAALTGGYSSTYGQAVGQQQYDAYLQQLNDVVPELYGMALDQHNQEGQDMLNQYAMVGGMADDEYGKYQDALNQYWQNLSYLKGQADDAYQMGFQADSTGYERQQDAYDKALNLVQMGYMPSDAELAAAGMSKEEAAYWNMLYQQQIAGSGGRGYGGDDEMAVNLNFDGEDNYLEMVLGRMGVHSDPAVQSEILRQYAPVLTREEIAIAEAELEEARKREAASAAKKAMNNYNTRGQSTNELEVSVWQKTHQSDLDGITPTELKLQECLLDPSIPAAQRKS